MAARQTKVPAAFLSYAHLDDEAYGGLISRLRERLAFAASVNRAGFAGGRLV